MANSNSEEQEKLLDNFYTSMHVLEDQAERLVLSYIKSDKARVKMEKRINDARKQCSNDSVSIAEGMWSSLYEVRDAKVALDKYLNEHPA